MLFGKIKALVEYGVRTGLIEAEDMIYTRNRLLEALCEEDYADEEAEPVSYTHLTLPTILLV